MIVGLHGLHAFTGCDTVGKFTGHGKKRPGGKIFVAAEEDVMMGALMQLGGEHPTAYSKEFKKLICLAYYPSSGKIQTLREAITIY